MIRLALLLLFALIAAPASADELRPAVIEMTERAPGEWALEWKLPVSATRAMNAAPVGEPVIPESCEMIGEPVQRAAVLALLGRADLRCEGSLADEKFGLTELLGNADAIARVEPLYRPVQTFRLTSDNPTATIMAKSDRWQVLRDYFIIGAEHILFGWDHLLFVVALVLLVRAPWPVVKAATAFTVAHSITLVATTLGYTGLPSRPVEALIALSIVFLAVEVALVLREPDRMTITRRYPWAVAFAFGLFHGFGFAGALADIGLPQGEIATALLAFNIGVEAGQLLVIALLIAFLAALSRGAPRIETPAIRIATYVIGITGSFWLIERVVG
ncbi:putative membrane protein [Erythrobacter sp. NAP1]|uniref:HupE/UreJ family protein n=1 Tax=Erythrobacter sp. NAP1 TaxID=237727 RepID=UPI0000687731|nr:HupE/UreJ family protein [Erythrobacter sp. NAP1]EAQ28195.1 putative membrane protein [Erythrobacter sp. NAP1]